MLPLACITNKNSATSASLHHAEREAGRNVPIRRNMQHATSVNRSNALSGEFLHTGCQVQLAQQLLHFTLQVAAFLASDAASYITGQTIYVDGGRLAMNYTVDVPDAVLKAKDKTAPGALEAALAAAAAQEGEPAASPPPMPSGSQD